MEFQKKNGTKKNGSYATKNHQQIAKKWSRKFPTTKTKYAESQLASKHVQLQMEQ